MLKLDGKWVALLAASVVLSAAFITASCSSTASAKKSSGKPTSSRLANRQLDSLSPRQMYERIRVVKRFIPKGSYGRRYFRPLRPRYITVHSTQNYTGDAWDHARALQRGKLRAPKRRDGNRIGYLTWHFTVQQDVAIQHLPTTEQGEHADFDGPGNRYSVGIEMCEHRGNNLSATVDRTAMLCASLMHQYGIPLRNVVPHYHWPRRGRTPANKNCPHFLMTNGRPGRKWNAFLRQVNAHFQRIRSQQNVALRGEPSSLTNPDSSF